MCAPPLANTWLGAQMSFREPPFSARFQLPHIQQVMCLELRDDATGQEPQKVQRYCLLYQVFSRPESTDSERVTVTHGSVHQQHQVVHPDGAFQSLMDHVPSFKTGNDQPQHHARLPARECRQLLLGNNTPLLVGQMRAV